MMFVKTIELSSKARKPTLEQFIAAFRAIGDKIDKFTKDVGGVDKLAAIPVGKWPEKYENLQMAASEQETEGEDFKRDFILRNEKVLTPAVMIVLD